MIGIVLVAHARIATETKHAVEHVLGEQAQMVAVDIHDSDATEKESLRLQRVLRSVDDGQGVLVLVDLYGATPWNLVRACACATPLMMIGGFNLPSVIRAAVLRQDDVELRALAEASMDAGQQYMRLDTDVSCD